MSFLLLSVDNIIAIDDEVDLAQWLRRVIV